MKFFPGTVAVCTASVSRGHPGPQLSDLVNTSDPRRSESGDSYGSDVPATGTTGLTSCVSYLGIWTPRVGPTPWLPRDRKTVEDSRSEGPIVRGGYWILDKNKTSRNRFSFSQEERVYRSV